MSLCVACGLYSRQHAYCADCAREIDTVEHARVLRAREAMEDDMRVSEALEPIVVGCARCGACTNPGQLCNRCEADVHGHTVCPCCGVAAVPAGEICEPCCVREADLLLRALQNPKFAHAFDQALLARAIKELA